jgi:hypothetical protein
MSLHALASDIRVLPLTVTAGATEAKPPALTAGWIIQLTSRMDASLCYVTDLAGGVSADRTEAYRFTTEEEANGQATRWPVGWFINIMRVPPSAPIFDIAYPKPLGALDEMLCSVEFLEDVTNAIRRQRDRATRSGEEVDARTLNDRLTILEKLTIPLARALVRASKMIGPDLGRGG